MYTCSICGVVITKDEFVAGTRSCSHKDAAVHANMTATVYGEGGMDPAVKELADAGVQ